MAEEKLKRTRKSHPKTRTGCLTCKIRRKKCGEEKPACLRCTSTGRKCDGYVTTPAKGLPTPPTSPENVLDSWADLEQVSGLVVVEGAELELQSNTPESDLGGLVFDDFGSPQPLTVSTDRHHNHAFGTPCSLSELDYHTPLTLQPSISPFSSSKDFYCFDFFCQQTNPLFTHYFETTMWAGPMMQACFHPAVQQAMIALGAAHRRFELGITPEAFDYCAFSMSAYSKAMVLTREFLETPASPASAELTVILSWLFGVFEVFQGNDEAASRHLKGGLQAFFAQKFRKQESRTVRRSASLNENSIRALFRKFEQKGVEIFGEPARILVKPDLTAKWPQCPEHFYSLEHARDMMFTQIHWNFYALSHEEEDGASRLASHTDRVANLIQWSAAYGALCKSLTTRLSPCQGHRAVASCLLRLCREMAYLLLLLPTTREHGSEVTFLDEPERVETMNIHFAKLLILADRLLSSDTRVFERSLKRPSFGADSGIQPPLYVAATKCVSTKIRHQAAGLMRDSPREEKLRNALGAWNIAERASMVEAEAVRTCGALPVEIADEAKWVDVTAFLEERKVLRSYCVPEKGTGVDSLVWIQEWITF